MTSLNAHGCDYQKRPLAPTRRLPDGLPPIQVKTSALSTSPSAKG